MDIRALVVNLEHFRRICIIVDGHSCVSDDCNATNFTGMQPTHMNMRTHAIGKAQIEMSSIVNMQLKMCMRLHFDLLWLLTQQVQENGNIMGSKVPDHIDV